MRLIYFLLIILFTLSACDPETSGRQFGEDAVAYKGATLIDGTGADPVANSVLVIENGEIIFTGRADDIELPRHVETVDVRGYTIVPGIINAHGHIGISDGIDMGPEFFTEEKVREQLKRSARYGVTSVVSLGDGLLTGAEWMEWNDDPALSHARYYMAGPVLDPDSVEDAVAQVQSHAEARVSWIKIRVDDQLGTREKMSPEIYAAIAEEATIQGLPVAAHIVDLEDAIETVRAGVSLVAHSVRDTAVTRELIDAMIQYDVPITPTLTREISTYIYRERPDFFDDPFFLAEFDYDVIEYYTQPEVQSRFAESAAGQYFEEQLPVAIENMMTLHEAGVRVALGTDSGPPARFQGFFEHLEMEMMQDAGMSPMEVLTASTLHAAAAGGIDHITGSLGDGKRADFLILSADPAEDIRNLREIESVYINGNRVDRYGW